MSNSLNSEVFSCKVVALISMSEHNWLKQAKVGDRVDLFAAEIEDHM